MRLLHKKHYLELITFWVWGLRYYLNEQAWINGGNPVFGYLNFGTSEPFAPIFQGMADSLLVAYLFEFGMLAIGSAFILGIGIRIASLGDITMMILIYLSQITPEHNPFMDQHIIYALLFGQFLMAEVPATFSLRGWWIEQPVVQKYPVFA